MAVAYSCVGYSRRFSTRPIESGLCVVKGGGGKYKLRESTLQNSPIFFKRSKNSLRRPDMHIPTLPGELRVHSALPERHLVSLFRPQSVPEEQEVSTPQSVLHYFDKSQQEEFCHQIAIARAYGLGHALE